MTETFEDRIRRDEEHRERQRAEVARLFTGGPPCPACAGKVEIQPTMFSGRPLLRCDGCGKLYTLKDWQDIKLDREAKALARLSAIQPQGIR